MGKGRGTERERESEGEGLRIRSRFCTDSREPDVGLELTNHKIMT